MMHSISTELPAKRIATSDSGRNEYHDAYRANRVAELRNGEGDMEDRDDPHRTMKGVLLAALLGAGLWALLIGLATWLIR